MRFYGTITLALAVVCLFGVGGLGAPHGRYVWVKCHPDAEKANCVEQRGPWVPLAGRKTRLPPSAAKDIIPVNKEQAASAMAQSEEEGSGFVRSVPLWMREAPRRRVSKNQESTVVMEASGDADPSNYALLEKTVMEASGDDEFPINGFRPKTNVLSSEDLKEDGIIP